MSFFGRLKKWVQSLFIQSAKFSYRFKLINFGKIPDPIIDLEVSTPQGWQTYRFLVDTGADTTTLPLYLASSWGLDKKKMNRMEIEGIAGTKILAYEAKIKVRIKLWEENIRCLFINTEIIPLLGRVDLWRKFNLFFDNKKQEIVLKRI